MKKQYVNIDNKKVPLIKGGKGCFAAGTMINTPNGFIPIEQIDINNEVYCFDEKGKIHVSKVTETFIHYNEELIEVYYWGNTITVTSNHWFLTEYRSFREIGDFKTDDALIDREGFICPILKTKKLEDNYTVYNFTVENYHTYIANNIRVHNKGGGKGGGTAAPGVEDPNTLFSTDLLFITTAVGEGPLYRINPNGLQDIEINESSIDDLLNLDGNGLADEEFFHIESTTGTLTQAPLDVFGDETIIPQNMSSPVNLKKGNISGVPLSRVLLQDTSVSRHDSIRFVFNINALQRIDNKGNIFGYNVAVRVKIYNRTGTSVIKKATRTINGKTNVSFRFTMDLVIPKAQRSALGYKFTVEKTTNDSDSSKIQDNVAFVGWQEVVNDESSYPRTALVGYGIKAAGQYTGGIPTFSSVVKGLIVKVPSNYDQPTLASGEIDWRELELPETGAFGYTNTGGGYRQQSTGSTVFTDVNPTIYRGLWDGSFIFSWSQNPVWILYDLLTNTSYGLGIPDKNIDKFRFYTIAQYCDAVDGSTGKYLGVDGYADGTFRYKPRNQFTGIRKTLIGVPSDTLVKERRFVCDITLAVKKQVLDLIVQIAGIFRGVLYYSGGKISLNVDLPNELPVAIFNETNIEKGSLSIGGIEESSILTGVEISYLEPNNHYRRELVRVDDPEALKETTQIENVSQIELAGVTRRSQAIRFGQYLLASSKFIRRKITFNTTIEAINLTVGDVIAISQRVPGTAWGYGGRIFSDSTIGSANVTLEHFTSPAISNTVFTANTLPIGLRVIGKDTDRVDLYVLSNTAFSAKNVGNTSTGSDFFELKILQTMSPTSRIFEGSTANANIFHANNVPTRGSVWTLGEINPTDFYKNLNDKLFKITNIARDEVETVTIQAGEYVSNVYIDSDTIINYVPVRYKDFISPFTSPPIPNLTLVPRLVRIPDGSVRNDIEVSAHIDRAAYPITLGIEYQYAVPGTRKRIESIIM